MAMAEKDSVRAQIVEAAKKRFSHFGYAKTTMAEIATDCAMSPGNLYRFFPGKLDIAEAIASEDYEHHLVHMRKIAVAAGKDARQHFINWMLAHERKILVELLDEAERRGEFVPPGDKETIAEMIQSATMKFRYPQLWSKLTLPKLERELDGVLNLMLQGLCPLAAKQHEHAA